MFYTRFSLPFSGIVIPHINHPMSCNRNTIDLHHFYLSTQSKRFHRINCRSQTNAKRIYFQINFFVYTNSKKNINKNYLESKICDVYVYVCANCMINCFVFLDSCSYVCACVRMYISILFWYAFVKVSD